MDGLRSTLDRDVAERLDSTRRVNDLLRDCRNGLCWRNKLSIWRSLTTCVSPLVRLPWLEKIPGKTHESSDGRQKRDEYRSRLVTMLATKQCHAVATTTLKSF